MDRESRLPHYDRIFQQNDGRSTPVALEDVLGEDQLAWVEHVAMRSVYQTSAIPRLRRVFTRILDILGFQGILRRRSVGKKECRLCRLITGSYIYIYI